MWTIAVKEFRQLRHDRRTVAMLLFMPLLLLIVFVSYGDIVRRFGS